MRAPSKHHVSCETVGALLKKATHFPRSADTHVPTPMHMSTLMHTQCYPLLSRGCEGISETPGKQLKDSNFPFKG